MKKTLLVCAAILTLAASAKAQEASCQHTDFRYTKTINNSDLSGRNLLEDNCLIIIPDAAMTAFRH